MRNHDRNRLYPFVLFSGRADDPLAHAAEKPARSGMVGRVAGRADGDGAPGAVRQRAGFHRRRAYRGRRRGAAAGGALLCRAGKSAALPDERGGQAANGRDGRRGDSADGAFGLSAIYAQHHARRGRLALVRAGDIRRFVHAPVVCYVAGKHALSAELQPAGGDEPRLSVSDRRAEHDVLHARHAAEPVARRAGHAADGADLRGLYAPGAADSRRAAQGGRGGGAAVLLQRRPRLSV